jgi:transcriptional regulator with XRE-family HTH domain
MKNTLHTDVTKIFGATLRELRKEKGFSQESLALSCELDRTYIGGIERGERNVSLINITKIAKALGVPPKSLLEGIEDA